MHKVWIAVTSFALVSCVSFDDSTLCEDIKTIYPQAAGRGFKDWQQGIKIKKSMGSTDYWQVPHKLSGFDNCELAVFSLSTLDAATYSCRRPFLDLKSANAAYLESVKKIRHCLQAAVQTSDRVDASPFTSFDLNDANNPWRLEITVWRHRESGVPAYEVEVEINTYRSLRRY